MLDEENNVIRRDIAVMTDSDVMFWFGSYRKTEESIFGKAPIKMLLVDHTRADVNGVPPRMEVDLRREDLETIYRICRAAQENL